jgi:hypothetical protein
MKLELTDTDPETLRVHREMLRRASPADRLHLALSLSATVLALARAGVERRFVDGSPEMIGLRFPPLRRGSRRSGASRSGGAPAMTEPDLLAAVGPVLDALQALGARHYVGGSIASSAHGLARASIDADVVAELRPEHAGRLVAALSEGYYISAERVRDAIARRASFNAIHLDTMLKVDVFVSKDRPFDRRAMERAQPQSVGQAGGRTLPVASPEDIVLAKLEWYRRGGETSERQWTDVIGVLQVGRGALDLAYLKTGALELDVADLLARALADTESADTP